MLSILWRKKPLKRVGKTGSKSLPKSCLKHSPNGPIYRARKTSRWSPGGLSVNRPVDRPTIIFQTVEPSVDRSVDRARIQSASLSVRSTTRSTEAFPESRALWTVDRLGRPALQPDWRARLCTLVDRVGRPTPSSVDLL